MIWKKMTHRQETLLFVVLPALCFILPLFCSYSASATDSGTVYLNADSGTRSYESPPGTYISAQNFITSATPTPIQLLGSANNNTLFGYNIGSSIDNVGIQWGPYTSLQISWKVGNRAGYSLYNWWLSDYDSKCLVYFNYQGDYVVSDAFVTDDIYDKTYTCNIQLPEGKRPIGIDVRNGSWRTASSNIQGIAYTSSIVTAASHEPIMFKELKMTYETGENPQTALLGEIAGLSQQQINQQQQIIDQDNEDRDQLESSSQESQEQGESAGDDASDTGTTLFGAFTSLVAALTNVHQTNCNLSIPEVDFQNGGSFALGTLDLCTLDVPSGLSALGSLLLVFLIVPMGINCAKRMLSLYNELLGGK